MELLKRALKNYERPNSKVRDTVDILKKDVTENGGIVICSGKERELGVSAGVLQAALLVLANNGYNVFGVGSPHSGDQKFLVCTKIIS